MTVNCLSAGPETLAPYDLVILNYYENRMKDWWWGDRANNALLDFVRSGKGLVMYHFSTAAFNGWDEYEKLSKLMAQTGIKPPY